MKIIQKSIIVTFVIVFLSACASLRTTSDFEKGTDFSQYNSYQIVYIDNEKAGIDEINLKRITRAVKNELSKKGLGEKSDADLQVYLHAMITNKAMAIASTGYYGGYAPYRWGRIGYGAADTTIDVEEYKEGTLVVDLVDSKNESLVWQGLVSGTIKENPKDREKNINNAVARLFEKYPPSE